jgi:hypothetical protein
LSRYHERIRSLVKEPFGLLIKQLKLNSEKVYIRKENALLQNPKRVKPVNASDWTMEKRLQKMMMMMMMKKKKKRQWIAMILMN